MGFGGWLAKMSQVFLYLPDLEKIATPVADFTKRLNLYVDSLSRNNKGHNSDFMLITTSAPTNQIGDIRFIWRQVSRFTLIRFWQVRKIIGNTQTKRTLISGNNHSALFVSLLVRLICKDVRIQTSIHAELSALMEDRTLKGIVKLNIMRVLVPKVDSLRLVTVRDIVKAHEIFKLETSKIFVAPVPLILPDRFPQRLDLDSISIGFVGRFHEERGVGEWIDIASSAKKRFPELKLKLVGDGPLRTKFEEELANFSDSVQYTGLLNQDQLRFYWPEIRVLLVCAAKESYGMASREALLSGTLVLARRNHASEELKMLSPELVSLYEDKEEALRNLQELFERKVSYTSIDLFRKKFLAQQSESLDVLAKSWI